MHVNTPAEQAKLREATIELYANLATEMVETREKVENAKTDGGATLADTPAGRKLKEAMAKLNQ